MGWIASLGRATAGTDKPWVVRVFRTIAAEAYHAVTRQHRIPLRKRIACWRHGFFADKAFLHDFDRYGYAPYLTDYERHVKLNRINDHGYILTDLGSTNGTWIGKTKVEEEQSAELISGKAVRVGAVQLTFLVAEEFMRFIQIAG